VALAELCFSSLNRESIGANLNLTGALSAECLLFAESPSRIVISFDSAQQGAVLRIAQQHNAPLMILGKTGGESLRIRVNEEPAVDLPITNLENAWRESLPQKLEAQAMAAGRE
jgi:phosphoribosylformylglycinamidine synthase